MGKKNLNITVCADSICYYTNGCIRTNGGVC